MHRSAAAACSASASPVLAATQRLLLQQLLLHLCRGRQYFGPAVVRLKQATLDQLEVETRLEQAAVEKVEADNSCLLITGAHRHSVYRNSVEISVWDEGCGMCFQIKALRRSKLV